MRATNVSEPNVHHRKSKFFVDVTWCKWWRALDPWFPFFSRSRCTPQWNPAKTTAAAYGWTIKFGEPSSFDSANGSTSWISVFRALFSMSHWLVCHAMKIGSNATDALIEDIRVEVLRCQMSGFKTYAEIHCRLKVEEDLQTFVILLYVSASSRNRWPYLKANNSEAWHKRT